MPVAEKPAPETSSAARGKESACAHCGLPVPAALREADAPRQFCCAGCREVHALLQEHRLGRYYELRAAAEPRAPAALAGGGDKSYAEMDDPGFRGRCCWAAPGGLEATELYLEGVHCSACVWLLERLPRLCPGLVEARLDLPRSRARLLWDPRSVSLSAIARRLHSIGYPPHPCRGRRAREAQQREDRMMLARIGLAGAAAGNVMAIAFALYGGMFHEMEPELAALFRWASLVVALPSVIWGGGVFFRGAWAALRLRILHMDVPISIGLLAGFLHGAWNTARGGGEVYFDSVTTLVFLLLVGRYLQQRQQRLAAESAELLASLAPSSARVIEGAATREVPLEALGAGALVEVRAGETVPADGVVERGRSRLDTSLLTGESRPSTVAPGDRVHAGTVNVSSRLEVRVECAGEETRVGRLMALVEEHARRRAPIVQLADRLSGRFVLAVLVLAAATFALWMRLDPARAVDHAVALLIVTCPCALGLATPLAVSAAIGQAARAGILVRGADVLEKLTRPGLLWLDKTGTLTAGRTALVEWWGEEAARPLVAAVEAHSSHPVARALSEALGDGKPGPGIDVKEMQGAGIEGWVGGRHVMVGAPEWVATRARDVPGEMRERLGAARGAGLSPVLVAVDSRVVAVAALGDPLRPDARLAVERVKARGWRVGVLSGDDAAVVAATAGQLGIGPGASRGRVSPEGKLGVVTEGLAEGTVVMVGDGVNDAAALAAATVGVGVHGGAEAALAAADVYITRLGVGRVADLIDGAHRAMAVVRRNLLFSLLYNTVGVSLAMGGLLDPLVAAVLMPASSLTVILSSYRARMFPRAPEEEATAWR
ncbi:MAG: heavy metal translocating P-type ATPase metal-binding domain-containing protein [Candidatus Rokubacteria bacterium]|nr:heavy metal translocating P-type ATPase metal-binding domain-containing protein [Candidatus Rokubacteria bacterium]